MLNISSSLGSLNNRRIYYQRNNTSSRKRGSLLNCNIAATSSNHNLVDRINSIESLRIKLKNTVNCCGNSELSLMGLFGYKAILAMAKCCHTICRIVFMKLVVSQLPHIKMLFAHAKQYRDISLFYYVTLLKAHALKARLVVSALARNNLSHIVTQYMSYCIFCSNLFHARAPLHQLRK